jgi:hypothetical protein
MHYLFDGAAVSSSLTNFLFGFFSWIEMFLEIGQIERYSDPDSGA